jgi:hypothetical protein
VSVSDVSLSGKDKTMPSVVLITGAATGIGNLSALVAPNEEATSARFPPGVEAHPRAVAQEIARILALPAGTRPFRSVVDFSNAGVDEVNAVMWRAQEQYVTRLGFGELLHVKLADHPPA